MLSEATKLHVPKDMPVSQFWALTIYDFAKLTSLNP